VALPSASKGAKPPDRPRNDHRELDDRLKPLVPLLADLLLADLERRRDVKG